MVMAHSVHQSGKTTHSPLLLMSSDPLYRTKFIADRWNLPTERLLKQAGIPVQVAEHRNALVATAKVLCFYEHLSNSMGTEHGHLKLVQGEVLSDTSKLGPLLFDARTLRDFFDTASRNYRLKQTAASYRLEVGGGMARVYHHQLLGPSLGSHQADLGAFGIMINHLRRALGPNWSPTAINFAYIPRERLPEAEPFENFRIVYGHGTSHIEFPAHLLGVPIPKCRPSASRYPAGSEDATGPIPVTLIDAVKAQLRILVREDALSLETVANGVGVSPRTIQRQLMGQGTSFRSLVSNERFHTACDWLSDTDMTVEEIAFALGYSDPSNFTRAFRFRAGTPPKQFREDLTAR